ncbi:MAG TPA: alpha/beta hydrolase-fold protein [Candidatus Dormibacteraeota bacterium]|nr:alpha/beta hydrolase-fold protein [Candidatus Dormibacteraeota bacterium]
MAEPRRPALSLVHRVRRPGVVASVGAGPPLLLLLHGVGSNELAMASIAGSFDPRFLVISARAPTALGPFAFGWLDEVHTGHGLVVDPAEVSGVSAAIIRFLDEAVDAYAVDLSRVFIAGFSQGGIVALICLLTAPEVVAGVVCMSGRLPPEVLPRRASPDRLEGKHALVVHGRDDDTLGVGYGRTASDTLASLGLTVAYEELEMGHTTTDASLARVSDWLTAQLDR